MSGVTDRMYTPAQTAAILGVSTERVRQLARSGRLPCIHTPLGRLFDNEAIEAFASTRDRAARGSRLA